MNAKASRITVRVAIRVVVSGAAVAVLLSRVDLDGLTTALSGIDPGVFAAAVVVQVAQFGVVALRWSMILDAAGLALGWWRTFRTVSAAMAANQVLPSSLGADLVRSWLARRSGTLGLDALTTVLADRVAGLLSLAVVGIASAGVLADALPGGIGWVPWAALGALLAGIAIVLSQRGRLSRFPRLMEVGEALDRLRGASRSPAWLATVFALSLVAHGMTAACLWLMARETGVEIDYLVALALLPPVVFALLVPITFAGWGVREGIVVAFLGLLGTPAAPALAASVAWGFATLAAALVGGAIWLMTPGDEGGRGRRDP